MNHEIVNEGLHVVYLRKQDQNLVCVRAHPCVRRAWSVETEKLGENKVGQKKRGNKTQLV